jgi:hypothetical protein
LLLNLSSAEFPTYSFITIYAHRKIDDRLDFDARLKTTRQELKEIERARVEKADVIP